MSAALNYACRSADDRRAHERYPIALPGQLFDPTQPSTVSCQVNCLSPGGAGVQCAEAPPLNTPLVLYVDGFGRFDAVAVRYYDGILGLRFNCKDTKQKRLKEKLIAFAQGGLTAVTHLRREARISTASNCEMIRQSGARGLCDVEDISLHGASLKTLERPPLGEIVHIGRTYGRVMRHHETGIGIEFVKSSATDEFTSAMGIIDKKDTN